MKKLLIFALMLMLVPASAMAMKGMEGMERGKKEMEHGKKMGMDKKMEHGGGMGMKGVIMLQDDVVDGVKGAAHLMDMKNGKGQMLMLMFTDAKSGSMITDGSVAVKIEDPDEHVSKAKKMKKSKGMFGTPVSFDKKGEYHFTVGTKLSDGEKRKFDFHYTFE